VTLTKYTVDYLNSQIDYYISEAQSFKQIIQNFSPEIGAIEDATFGIIVGCVYSAFLRAYENEKKQVDLEDMHDFNKIIKDKAPIIKRAILG
jgi:predicted ATP-dependent protease